MHDAGVLTWGQRRQMLVNARNGVEAGQPLRMRTVIKSLTVEALFAMQRRTRQLDASQRDLPDRLVPSGSHQTQPPHEPAEPQAEQHPSLTVQTDVKPRLHDNSKGCVNLLLGVTV